MFLPENLKSLASDGDFTMWTYKTTDAFTTLLEANYFNSASETLQLGDIIIARTNLDTESRKKTIQLEVIYSQGGSVGVDQL